MTDRTRARGRASGRGLDPLTRDELEQGISALVAQYADGRLSMLGLVDSLVVLADTYVADTAERQAERRRVLARRRERNAARHRARYAEQKEARNADQG